MARNYKDLSGSNNPRFRTGLKIKGCEESGIYNSWQNMKGRCLRKTHPKYKRYGGRGIKIYKDWMDIKKFYEWAKLSNWEKGMSIDRINNDGNYCPENCRWVSVSENSRKKRTTKISFDCAKEIRTRIEKGENPHDLAIEYGVVYGTIWFIKNNFTHVDCMEHSKIKKYVRLKNKKNVVSHD